MSPTQAAWLAGFLDGEGSFTRYQGGKFKSECWRIAIPNCNLDALIHIREITGTGNIGLKRKASGNYSDQWQWQIGSKLDMESIARTNTSISTDQERRCSEASRLRI